jgi:hypothetical protein
MASRANVEMYAHKNGTSFNEAKRRLGGKHAKGSAHRAPPSDPMMPARGGVVAGTGKPKGGSKT